jgi:hypothetical protein
MLAVLSLIACLADKPAECRVYYPEMEPEEGMGLAGCAVMGQRFAAQWAGMHPGWEVKKVRCSIGVRRDPAEAVLNGVEA